MTFVIEKFEGRMIKLIKDKFVTNYTIIAL
jgi:hypothetical protein